MSLPVWSHLHTEEVLVESQRLWDWIHFLWRTLECDCTVFFFSTLLTVDKWIFWKMHIWMCAGSHSEPNQAFHTSSSEAAISRLASQTFSFFFSSTSFLFQTRLREHSTCESPQSHISSGCINVGQSALVSFHPPPLPRTVLSRGTWWERGNIARIREEEESERPRGERRAQRGPPGALRR